MRNVRGMHTHTHAQHIHVHIYPSKMRTFHKVINTSTQTLRENFQYFYSLTKRILLYFYSILTKKMGDCALNCQVVLIVKMTHFPKNQMGNDRGAEFCFDTSWSYTTPHHRHCVFQKKRWRFQIVWIVVKCVRALVFTKPKAPLGNIPQPAAVDNLC